MERCVFCAAWEDKQDDENQIIWRDENCFVIMNKYPYSPGHFMVIPANHECNLEALDTKTWLRMSELAQLGVKILKEKCLAAGVNLGMNLGAAAGAGIAEHLHLHVLPRYHRDTNFITAIAHTRVYSADENKVYEKLKKAFINAINTKETI
jgi:diadenosine tetraphosphate (Ap4A) HIT family hydrolase